PELVPVAVRAHPGGEAGRLVLDRVARGRLLATREGRDGRRDQNRNRKTDRRELLAHRRDPSGCGEHTLAPASAAQHFRNVSDGFPRNSFREIEWAGV